MADMKKRTEEDKQRELAFFVSLDNRTGIFGELFHCSRKLN